MSSKLLSWLIPRATRSIPGGAPQSASHSTAKNAARRAATTRLAEPFVPSRGLALEPYLAADDRAGIQALTPYAWAAEVLRCREPARVLDFGCGTGYGSRLLAEALPEAQITGCDSDLRAIRVARQGEPRSNLQYLGGDTLVEGRYEAIVCFDTLPYVRHREVLLQQFVEALEAEGCLLLSTVIGPELDLAGAKGGPRLHYSPAALYDFLARYFHTILMPDNDTLPCMDLFSEVINRGTARYATRMNPLACENPIRVRRAHR